MKKILLLSILIITLPQSSKASHVWGGTIYWQCLNNGQYQFFMEIYRDCTGIPFSFEEETITIVGSHLPVNLNWYAIDKITMSPDSSKWLKLDNGNISPSCTPRGNRYKFDCANGDRGAVQQFFYKSDSITFYGTPPIEGWKFYWESVCCRPGTVENIQTTGSMLLRAVMYPTVNSDRIDSCFYSSPQFISPPTTIVCRGENAFNNIGIQREGDSISFSWDRTYNPPYGSPVPLTYYPGYSPTNPTPDKSFDSRNEPSRIDTVSGNINLAVYNGFGPKKYINVVQIDSWRDGKIVATTYRELPLSIVDCDSLDNGKPNKKPVVYLNRKKQRKFTIDVHAGTKINIPIEVIDSDYVGLGTTFQHVSLKPYGQLYASDFTDTLACDFPPCAVLKNTSPTYDSSDLAYFIKGQGSLSSNFEWQTHCSHLDKNGESKTYLFYYKVQDNHCPIPESTSGVIVINLHEKDYYSRPSMAYIHGSTTYKEISWNAQDVSAYGFKQWYIYGSTTENGTYQLVDSIGDFSTQRYIDSISANRFYFVKAKLVLCNANPSYSQHSDTIHNNINILTLNRNSSGIELKWTENRSSYRNNEVRKYEIYRSSYNGDPYQLVGSVSNQLSFDDQFETCNQFVKYFVKGDDLTASKFYKNDTSQFYFPLYQWNQAILNNVGTLYTTLEGAAYQWYDCNADSLIKGATNRTYLANDTGFYGLIVEKLGCSDTLDCFRLLPKRPQGQSFEQLVYVYPNPSNGVLNVEIDQVEANIGYKLRNSQGELVDEMNYENTNTFRIEMISKPGIYFLELINYNGDNTIIKVVNY